MELKTVVVPQWYSEICEQAGIPYTKYVDSETMETLLSRNDYLLLWRIFNATSGHLYSLFHPRYFAPGPCKVNGITAIDLIHGNGEAYAVDDLLYPRFIDCGDGTILAIACECECDTVANYMEMMAKYITPLEVVNTETFKRYARHLTL